MCFLVSHFAIDHPGVADPAQEPDASRNALMEVGQMEFLIRRVNAIVRLATSKFLECNM